MLLLSPEAAASDWVGKEIEHWKEHSDPSRILPVVTDGEFGWADGDVTGTSVPAALRGVFTEEPRWVDLRFARGDDQLDLKNPTFSAAIADVTSAVRGIPKDELESEEVRQHRRTIRTAWAAGVIVLLLGVAATIGAVVAVNQSNEAQTQRDEAQTQRDEAERLATAEATARAEADANADLATQNAAEADANADEAAANADEAAANAEAATQSAALAKARELAASAINLVDEDPELSILLALEGIAAAPEGQDQPVEVIDALWNAVQQDRLLRVIDTGHSDGVFIALSPDESTLFVVNGFPVDRGIPEALIVQAYSTSDFEQLWEFQLEMATEFRDGGILDGDRRLLWLHASPDGTRVSVGVIGTPNRFLILDATDGTEIDAVLIPDTCNPVRPRGWSPDGSRYIRITSCQQADESWEDRLQILDGETFAVLRTIDLPTFSDVPAVSFDDAGRLFLTTLDDGLTIYSPPDYSQSTSYPDIRGWGDVTQDGSVVVTFDDSAAICASVSTSRRADCGTLGVFNTATGERIDVLTPLAAAPSDAGLPSGFSGRDRLFAVPTEGAKTVVWDIASGEQVFALPSGETTNSAMTSDGNRLYTSHVGGDVLVWELGPTIGRDSVGDLGSHTVMVFDSVEYGEDLGAFVAFDPTTSGSMVFFFDLATGALTGHPVEGHLPITGLANDRFLIADPFAGAPSPYSWSSYDPMTGAKTRLAGCDLDLDTGLCPDGTPSPFHFWTSSQIVPNSSAAVPVASSW